MESNLKGRNGERESDEDVQNFALHFSSFHNSFTFTFGFDIKMGPSHAKLSGYGKPNGRREVGLIICRKPANYNRRRQVFFFDTDLLRQGKKGC